MRTDDTVSAGRNPHIDRAKRLVRSHPGVRGLFGPYPPSALWAGVVVAGQLFLAWTLSDAHRLVNYAAAYFVGAFASHALFVLIHDASHNLILHGGLANRLIGILCNVGQGFPSAMSFRAYHLLRHGHLAEVALAELPASV